MMGWDLEKQLGVEFDICSYPQELQSKWLEERRKRMKAVFTPTINPVAHAGQVYQQMLAMVIQADNKAESLHREFMDLLRSLKSGEVSLELLQVGENGFEILAPEPIEIVVPEIASTNGSKRERVPAK